MPWKFPSLISWCGWRGSGFKERHDSSTTAFRKPPSAGSIENPRPPAPRDLLSNRAGYEIPLLNRSPDRENDAPLAALYRIYEHLILDQHIELRNELEAFWFRSSWAVSDIPDPLDPDPERYACLACIPALLCLAFNKRIEMGLPRDAPSIFTRDMLEEWKAQEREYEREPNWVTGVSRLDTTLAIPHWDNEKRDFVPLDGFEDEKASKEFAKKNILIWQPHIHFA